MAHHLTPEERDRIAELRHQDVEQKQIAGLLNRSPSTICRELKRNSTGSVYYAGQAQREAERRRSERPLDRKMDDPQINEQVRSGLGQNWSPEQIAGRMKHEQPDGKCVSRQTIYTWLHNDEQHEYWESCLRGRGKRRCRRKAGDCRAESARIEGRPEVINERMRLGDFEGDTVLGPPGTGGLATLVDRKSRLTIIVKVQSKNADHVHEKLKQRLKQLDEQRRRSITFDNGTEFARCHRLEKHLGIELYFAKPGCPYQRGTNENTNGLIRQYFPKGTDFRDVSHHEVRRVENLLNTRPRACLRYQTPHEVSFEKDPPRGCD